MRMGGQGQPQTDLATEGVDDACVCKRDHGMLLNGHVIGGGCLHVKLMTQIIQNNLFAFP